MRMMRRLAVCSIWLGYGIVVAAIAFGAKNGEAAFLTLFWGPGLATIATVFIVEWPHNKERLMMRLLAVCSIWLGYGIAVAAVSFGTKDGGIAMAAGFLGALFATVATGTIVEERY